MNTKMYLTVFVFFISAEILMAQKPDSLKAIILKEVQISEKNYKNEIERLPEVQGTIIYSGKKNEVVKVSTLDADLSTNNPRQIFGKVPGVTIWENDGSGIQMGIATGCYQ